MSGGKTRPAKLDVFRLTSADERSIRAAAAIYGGECREWKDAPVGEQWELKTESKALDVIVPPVDLAFSQWMELWSGGGCQRRCDGQVNVIDNGACECDPDDPECKPTTRLGVILSALEGIGIWRLEVKGWNGAQELLGTIEILRGLQARGQMVPARLLLEQRQSKKGGQTRNFAVPVLDLELHVAAEIGQRQAPALAAPITPIQQGELPPAPSIAEQVRAVEAPATRRPRANAAAPLPATGIAPRPAAAIAPAASDKPPTPKPAADDRTPGGASQKSVRRLFAVMNGNREIGKERDDRLAWASSVLGRTVTTFDELSQPDVTKLNDAAEGKPTASDNGPTYYEEGEEPF